MKIKGFILLMLLSLTIKVKAQVEIISAGTGAAYTLNVPAIFPLRNGVQVTFKAHIACAASPTIDVTGTGAISIKKEGGGTSLAAGDIKVGQIVTLAYDGTFWQMLTDLGNPPTTGSVTGSGTQNYVTKWNNAGGTTIGNSSIFDNGSAVGIFNTTPAGEFHIFRNTGPRIVLDGDGTNAAGTTMLDFTTTGSNAATSFVGSVQGWQFRSFTNSFGTAGRQNDLQLRYYDGATFNNQMYFDNTGNIGINILNPTSRLYIVGSGATSATSSLRITNSASADMFYVDDNGSVGIKTALPSANLHVVGTARITSLVGPGTVIADASGNLSIAGAGTSTDWSLTGNSGTTPGTNFVGTIDGQALMFKVNATKSGYLDWDGTKANTGFGYQTLSVVSTGAFNLANGYNALQSNTTGSSNTAIGYYALNTNVAASSNSAFGAAALRSNTYSEQNVAVGVQSLFNQSFANGNTPWATNNVAVGYQALYFTQPTLATNGYQNSALGTQALYNNTTGSGNTAVGYQALYNKQQGANNIAIGYQAYMGAAAGNGSNSIAIGTQTGTALTSGNSHILIGYKAGDAITTGAGDVVIGYDIDAPSNTANNQLTIGNLIYGTSLDGTGVTPSSGNIGIGVNAPASKLHSAGQIRSGIPLGGLGGAAAATGSLLLYNSSNTNTVTVQSPITTATYSFVLPVNGGTASYILQTDGTGVTSWVSASAAASAWNLGGNAVGSLQTLGTTTAFDLPFITSNTERMRLNSTGTMLYPSSDNSLSLGSTANSWKDVNADGYLYISGARWTSLVANNTFIGTKGNESVSTGLYNLGVGQGAGNLVTTGNRNTIVGHRAGESLTTASDNTLIGNLAGGLTSTLGDNNTLLGSYAGYNGANSGYANTFVGSLSGQVNTTGHDNAFFGAYSGYNNTTGIYNTFLGDLAGQGNLTGSLNTFSGYLAGNANTSDNNSFYGYSSGRTNTSGTSNSFYGLQSGYNNLTGGSNSYFGVSAGYNATGNFNTFMGMNSGQSVTSGDYNTLVGSSAGVGVAAMGNYNTYLGYQATGSAGITNASAIGKNATVTISNAIVLGGTGADVVKVGIGNTAPSTQLHVSGNARITGLVGPGVVQADASGNLTLASGGTITGSGTTNYVARWTPSGTQLGIGTLYDNGTQVGIGNTAPLYPLDINTATGATHAKFGSTNSVFVIANSPMIGYNVYFNGGFKLGSAGAGGTMSFGQEVSQGFSINTAPSGAANGAATLTSRIAVLNGGNVGIGTTAPVNLLDVEGEAVIGATYSGTQAAPANGLLIEGQTGIGITTGSITAKLDVTNSATTWTSGSTYATTIQGATYGSSTSNRGVVGVSWANAGTYGIGVYGSSLGTAPNNYGVYGNAQNGTTTNYAGYFDNGNVLINNNLGVGIAPTSKLHVSLNTSGILANFDNNTVTSGTGLYTTVNTTATGAGNRYGLESRSWYGQSASYGTYSYGYGGVTSYGIYAIAGGATTNYAAYLTGGDVYVSGQVGIGTTAPAYDLQLVNNSAAKPTSNVWTVASDARLKTNVHDYTDGLSALLSIHPVWFTYTGEAGMPKETGVGVLAQELQTVAPYMVKDWKYIPSKKVKRTTEKSTETGPAAELEEETLVPDYDNAKTYLAVDNGAVTYMTINAIKELNLKLETELKKKDQQIKELDAKYTDLLKRLSDLEKK